MLRILSQQRRVLKALDGRLQLHGVLLSASRRGRHYSVHARRHSVSFLYMYAAGPNGVRPAHGIDDDLIFPHRKVGDSRPRRYSLDDAAKFDASL